MVTPIEYMGVASGEWQEAISKIYAEYQKRLAQSGGLDFDDLLFETVRLFNRDNELLSRYQEQIKYLLIDEYQDTNSVQYKLAKLLSRTLQKYYRCRRYVPIHLHFPRS